jgi:hypothetical protein
LVSLQVFAPMAALSKSEIIRKYLIGGGLDAFRDSFSSACEELGYRGSPDAVWQLSNEGKMLQPVAMLFLTCIGLRNLALDLFLTL